MKKRLIWGIILIVFTFALTGCVDVGNLNLTEDEEAQIVGYTTELLTKYDSNSKGRLVDTTQKRLLNQAVEEYNAKQAELKKTEKKSKSKSENDSSSEQAAENVDPYATAGEQDIAKALGQPSDIGIYYTGYENCKTYPTDSSSEGFFNMSATQGNDLLVFHFDIINMGDASAHCDILDVSPMFRMIVNGNERKNALTTLLLNDLCTVDTDIESGNKIDSVVVLEVPEGYADQVNSVKFLIKNGEEQSIIPIIE